MLQEGFVRTCKENLELLLNQQHQPQPFHARPLASSDTATSDRSSKVADAAQAEKLQQPSIQGAYLWGPVGSGKTLLMDMFRSTLPTTIKASSGEELPLQVLRMHFHEFMAGFHQRNHQIQQSLPRMVVKSRSGLPVYRYSASAGG